MPLFHIVLPVAASSAYRTAGTDLRARCAADSDAGPPRYSPLETAKTMPSTTIGASGDVRSCDCQTGSSDSFSPSSRSLNATIRPFGALPFCVNVTPPAVPEPVILPFVRREVVTDLPKLPGRILRLDRGSKRGPHLPRPAWLPNRKHAP